MLLYRMTAAQGHVGNMLGSDAEAALLQRVAVNLKDGRTMLSMNTGLYVGESFDPWSMCCGLAETSTVACAGSSRCIAFGSDKGVL